MWKFCHGKLCFLPNYDSLCHGSNAQVLEVSLLCLLLQRTGIIQGLFLFLCSFNLWLLYGFSCILQIKLQTEFRILLLHCSGVCFSYLLFQFC